MGKNKNIFFYLVMILCVFDSSSCNKKVEAKMIDDNIGNEDTTLFSKGGMDTLFNSIVGVDQFGRSFSTISSLREDKQVGLFFWLWIGQPYASGIYDASKILAMPGGLKLLTDPDYLDETISPNGQAHFWGKPIWGYYNSEDLWVIRKQIKMLTIAGVDFIFFDATNSLTYKKVYLKILKVIDEYQKEGWHPPKVAFYTHSKSFQTIRQLYRELYKPKLFPNTWYRVKGKPLIVAYKDAQNDLNEAKSRSDFDYVPGRLSSDILNFFYFRKPQWPSDPVFPNGFPWIEWIFPQPMHNGVMNVTVASHPSVPMSFSLTRGLVNWGRGWDPDFKVNISDNVDKGTFFQRQWDHALASDPDMITIGGWNEWIAYKQLYMGEYVLVDAVNKEYSRDIEPMEGGYEDAFYIQMIKNIRRYKGIDEAPTPQKKRTINIFSHVEQWNEVSPIAINMDVNRSSRNNYGATNKIFYSQPAANNLIREIKVAHDDKNIYFFIRLMKPFTITNNKLNILIGAGRPSLKKWESYEYLIGENFGDGEVSVGELGSDFKTVSSGKAKYTTNENIIQIECSREYMGLRGKDRFYFKIAMGIEKPYDIMSYYTSGVSMPMGRLSYMYVMGN